jgi:RNA polymerase sigma-70 factor, ECF subfamily
MKWKAETLEQNCRLTPVTLLETDLISAGRLRFEPSEFAAFLREHQGMVFSLACHFLRDRALAEEVAQEVFLRLYQNLASIESPGHMVRWLRKVTWRLCIDEVRRRPNLKPVSLDEISEPAAAQPAADPQLAERLRRLVAELPEGARMAVILRYQEDMDPAEIADVLDLPINTVKSRLHRGLLLLRNRLTRQTGGIEK